ncbi:MAG: type II toxin-antitoxin system RelE/ParE family toxin [Gammaproteobacteria bacterium]|nr:type II toxin-antitoxin system RelE/ParE family toxin [Gammaproteobacteria bacterium]
MIRSFKSKLAQDVCDGVKTRYARKLPVSLRSKAQRLLDQLNAATQVDTLRIPPSNKLRKLTGNLAGFWRIKIDKQWAVIFRWEKDCAYDVVCFSMSRCF